LGKLYDFFTQWTKKPSDTLTTEQSKQASQTTPKATVANQTQTSVAEQKPAASERPENGLYFQNRLDSKNAELEGLTGMEKYSQMANIEEGPRSEFEGRSIQQTYERACLELEYYLSGSAPFGYQYQHTIEEAKEMRELMESLHGKLPSMTVQPQNAYMTEEEQRIYYTLLGAYGGKTAKEYYLLIADELSQRQGYAEAQKIQEEDSGLLQFIHKTLYAADTGIRNSIQNLGSHFVQGDLPALAGNYGMQEIRENSSKLGAAWYGAIESIARQAPSLIMKGVTGSAAIGYVFSFLDVSGNAYAQKKKEGASNIEARLYSILAGSTDIIVDKLLGGIGKSTGLTEAKFLQKADQLDDIFDRVVAKTMVEIGGEIAEEEVQLFLEPAIESALYGKDYDMPNWEEIVETALTTAIATGLRSVPGIAKDEIANQKNRGTSNLNEGDAKAGDAGKSAASTTDADTAAKPATEADAPDAPADPGKTAKPATEADAPDAPADPGKTAKPATETDAPDAPADPGKTAKPATEADAPDAPKTDLEALRKELDDVDRQLFSLGMDDTYGPEVAATEEGRRLLERKAALESEIAETERALAQEAKAKTAEGENVESADKTEVDSPDDQAYNKDKARLPEDQWTKLKNETGWPAEILNYIRSMEEAAIYQKENLTPKKVGDRWALVMDVDMDYVDPRTHLTNRLLIALGRSPRDSKTGETIELHHLGQEFDSPFVELTASAHRGAENNLTLHPTREDSWRNDRKKDSAYRKEKRRHWKTRKNNTNEGSIKHETQKHAEGIGPGYHVYDSNKGPDPGGRKVAGDEAWSATEGIHSGV